MLTSTHIHNVVYFVDAFTTSQLVFHWRKTDPVEFNDNLELPQFNVEGHETLENCKKSYHTGRYCHMPWGRGLEILHLRHVWTGPNIGFIDKEPPT